ncbi:MAG: adenylate/guanylate cyclase domain-containing protein [Alphaproteobacteria bacterium]
MARHVTYEIHVHQKGRWEIHARYESSGMDEAIEEARSLDLLASVDEVKVIREIYDDESGNTREYNVYRTPGKAAQEESASAAQAPGGSSGGWATESNGDGSGSFGDSPLDDYDNASMRKRRARSSGKKRGKKKQKATFTGVLVKILLIILFSVTLAGLMSGGAVQFLRDTSLSNNVQTNIVFGIFIVIFLFSAVVMSMSFLGKDELGKAKVRPVRTRARTVAPPPQEKKPKPERKKKKEKKKKKEITEAPTPSEEALASTAVEDEEVSAPEEDDFQSPLDEMLEPEQEQEDETPYLPPPGGLSEHAEKQRVYLMKFLSGGLEGTASDISKLDSFNKFGLNLYLAGGCEILGQTRNLDVNSSASILAETISLMGFKPADAAKFSTGYEDYLLADSRYMQMFQAGRNAMNHTLDEEPDAAKYMSKALNEWNKPKAQEESSGPVTVLFTDIAGSTAMTQTLGDAVAQQIVRAHNRIVRDALTQFSGKEIKHTGDGIMASFATTSHGVEGAINIQQNIVKHNEHNPDLPLKIKIGINAGEPISEDNDLFGSTVQMAARIVDKAQANEIFVSEIVRGICAGKPLKFKSRGAYEMKGFDTPPTLYEALWKEE